MGVIGTERLFLAKAVAQEGRNFGEGCIRAQRRRRIQYEDDEGVEWLARTQGAASEP